MKRILSICGFVYAMILLHGCSLGDTIKVSSYIGFNPVIGHTVRAAEESVPFPADRTFKVWAMNCIDGDIVLEGESISKGTNGWLSGRVWPEAKLEFAAYWPTDIVASYVKGEGIAIDNFASDDIDLLVAYETADYDYDSMVMLHFEHVLSKVELRIKHSLYEDMEIELKRIVIDGYGKQGSYAGIEKMHRWRLGSEEDRKVIYDAKSGAKFKLSKKAQYIGSSFYTIPQSCENTTITVEYNVRIDNGVWVSDSMTTPTLETDWESGKQYTYTLNLTDTQLTYTTGISNWNNRESHL